jgi:hypothetical protein
MRREAPTSPASARSRCPTTLIQGRMKRAMDQFRWFTGGWRVNAELPFRPRSIRRRGPYAKEDIA